MKKTAALKTVLVVGLAGMAFSGYLSFGEIFGRCSACSADVNAIFGIPVCVIGFFMYLLIVGFCLLGLYGDRPERW
jgi:uncharacterized membrane protein